MAGQWSGRREWTGRVSGNKKLRSREGAEFWFCRGAAKGNETKTAGLVIFVGDEAAEEGDLSAADVGAGDDVIRVEHAAVLRGGREGSGLDGDEVEEIRVLAGKARVGTGAADNHE